jgi:hypothetical protein
MTTLKTPVEVVVGGRPRITDTAMLDGNDQALEPDELREVARRANLHEELVAALRLARREMERASMVGEVKFKTNALASGVAIGLEEAMRTADDTLSRAEVKP